MSRGTPASSCQLEDTKIGRPAEEVLESQHSSQSQNDCHWRSRKTPTRYIVHSMEEESCQAKNTFLWVIILLCPPCKEGVGQSMQKPSTAQSKQEQSAMRSTERQSTMQAILMQCTKQSNPKQSNPKQSAEQSMRQQSVAQYR